MEIQERLAHIGYIQTYGWKYLRVEKWMVFYGNGSKINTLYGVKVLCFKLFFGKVGLS